MGRLRNYFINHYPRTDFHELNQDWMISMLYDMINQVENFVEMNSVKYADPIQWDITRQYEKNTIVVDAITGTAYISSKPVPMGVALSRTEYWSVIFDLGRFITLASQNFANSYEAVLTTTATMETDKDKWLVWNSILYRAKNDIHIGDRYVIDGNIEKYTVEMFFDELAHLIAEETEARIEADNVLHGEIVDESVARENADSVLQNNIDAEATAREDADDILQNNIDAEATAREDADETLQNNIEVLQDNIDTEATARENADSVLGNRIDSETTNRINAINEINKGSLQTPEMYGAYGDGIHDDTEACQLCLNENPISYFPNNYLVTNLVIPQGHVLMGGSVDTKGIICTEGSVVPMASAIIMNLRLHSYNTLGIGNNSSAIEIYKPFVTISNVHVINCAQALNIHDDYGIYCSGLSVLGLHVEHCTASIIYITQSNDLYFENCILNSSLDGATQSTTSDGIQMYGFVQAVNFVNCAILQSRRGLYCNNPSISSARDQTAMCKFTNCWFDSNVNGAYLEWCRNFDFVNCWFASRDASDPQSGNGAVLHHCEQIMFTGCTFDSCNNACINMLNNSDDVVIVGCKFLNTPIGVYCGDDVNRIVINGNFFGNSKTKDINITMTRWVFLSDQCSGILLTNNATSGLTLVNNSTSSYNIINNNMVMPAD